MMKRLLPSMLKNFLALESAGGIVMIATTVVALFAANSLFLDAYDSIIHYPLGPWELSHWVSEVLMVLFFLLVGLELKREMVEGFLSQRDQILLPGVAALAGMAIPAAIYMFVNYDIPPNWNGWAIPAATDIAFALCILSLVGRGTPHSVKIFLLAIAIFDDLGAILVIAFFYSGIKSFIALSFVLLGTAALALLNRMKIMLISPYLVIGVFLWFALHEAGVHTTIAGVLVGLLMPTRGSEGRSPVDRLIKLLHPWVAFGIMPLFAFVSAGVTVTGIALGGPLSPIMLGIALGLFVGKQIGIFSATWLCIKLGLARIPANANWLHIYGVSIIAGIGFTMSLFVGILAFPQSLQPEVKIGVLCGSLLSVIWGAIVLKWAQRPNHTENL